MDTYIDMANIFLYHYCTGGTQADLEGLQELYRVNGTSLGRRRLTLS